jgi:hypothetical protein
LALRTSSERSLVLKGYVNQLAQSTISREYMFSQHLPFFVAPMKTWRISATGYYHPLLGTLLEAWRIPHTPQQLGICACVRGRGRLRKALFTPPLNQALQPLRAFASLRAARARRMVANNESTIAWFELAGEVAIWGCVRQFVQATVQWVIPVRASNGNRE